MTSIYPIYCGGKQGAGSEGGSGDMLAANNLSDIGNSATARINLGLGSLATQSAGSVSITGGGISGITDLAIADGGTGASTATAAFDNLSPNTTKGDIAVRGASSNIRLGAGSNGDMLVADSSATNGLAWYNRSVRPYTQSGRYLTPNVAALSTITLTANIIFTAPVFVQKRSVFTAIGFSVSAFTYTATALNISTAIYADSGGVPGALVAGTTAATVISSTVSSATNYDGTFSSPVTLAPGIYWLAILADSPSSTTIISSNTASSTNLTGVSTMANNNGARVQVARTYGSGFIDPFGTPTFAEAAAFPWLGLKVQ